jgi:predicted RecB family nuclease
MEKAILSKSTFIRGLQCEKSLYLYKHNYNLRDEISSQLQAIFSQGTNVGILAQELFPNGVDASPSSYFKMQESVFKTQEFIESGEQIIYEATFQHNGVLSALDILVKDKEGWKAYEVKSSTSVSETYILDAAI